MHAYVHTYTGALLKCSVSGSCITDIGFILGWITQRV